MTNLQLNLSGSDGVCWDYGLGDSPLPSGVGLSLLPNPVNDEVRIYYRLSAGTPGYFALYDIWGKQVYETILPASKQQINFRSDKLSAGIYFYRANIGNTSEHEHTGKLTIMH